MKQEIMDPPLSLIAAARTRAGSLRDHNEDSIWMNARSGVFVLADGIGGCDAGEWASWLTVKTVGRFIVEYADNVALAKHQLIAEAIEYANRQVREAAAAARQQRGMGATVVAALVHPPKATICHAGDARAYLIHNRRVRCLTEDDAVMMRAIGAEKRNGRLADDNRQFITKAVGKLEQVRPHCTELRFAPDDWLLLCSDGCWSALNDAAMLSVTQDAYGDPARVVNNLIDIAYESGVGDDVSIIAVQGVEAQHSIREAI